MGGAQWLFFCAARFHRLRWIPWSPRGATALPDGQAVVVKLCLASMSAGNCLRAGRKLSSQPAALSAVAPRCHMERLVKGDKKKQSLYFPTDMLDEMQREAERQERPLSWIMQQAWKLSRDRIMTYPGVEEL